MASSFPVHGGKSHVRLGIKAHAHRSFPVHGGKSVLGYTKDAKGAVRSPYMGVNLHNLLMAISLSEVRSPYMGVNPTLKVEKE